MERTGYYSVTVRKFSVLSRHTDWMKKTQDLYNEILDFYYNLYLDTVADTRSRVRRDFQMNRLFFRIRTRRR